MPRIRLLEIIVVALLGFAGCGSANHGRTNRQSWEWTGRREDYIRRSQVWLGNDLSSWVQQMRGLDLLAGPGGDGAFAFEELVRCSFVEPRHALSGATPKFLCWRDPPDLFKVKWGEENGEVYAEVAGTRLLWALGFAADADYAVQVECSGCADNPWRDQTMHPGHLPPVFAPAIVEREFPGRTIEEERDQGWTWGEFARIDPAANGAPRAHSDALALLAAFMQHRDSKADNQRLVCMPEGIVRTPDGRLDCVQPVMLIQDLGSAFGGPSWFATHKMKLEAWGREPLWKDARRCIANVSSERDATDGLDDPQISEEGRRFLSVLLDALDDGQIAGLFTAARAEHRGGVARWVDAFKMRRDQVRHPVPGDPSFRCPEG